MLWEAYWALVDAHGYNADLYGDWTTGGNNLAIQLVTDGLRLTPCNPGFVDARDAVIEADQALTGGANSCILWRAFAKRGLGSSAEQRSSQSAIDGIEAFDVPSDCGEPAATERVSVDGSGQEADADSSSRRSAGTDHITVFRPRRR
jgi:hypothetical protein